MDLEQLKTYTQSLPRSAIPEFLSAIKQKGINEQIPIVTDDVGILLRFFTRLTRPKRILELGAGISYSTHWMLAGSPKTYIDSVEQNHDRIRICRRFLESSGFARNVQLHHCWIMEYFLECNDEFDMIFLDSMKKEYHRLLPFCVKHLKPGGVFIADNVFFRGNVWQPDFDATTKNAQAVKSLKRFNQEAASHEALESCFLAMGDGLLIALKK